MYKRQVVVDAGDSQSLQAGQIVTARKLRDENSMLKPRDLKPVEVRDAVPCLLYTSTIRILYDRTEEEEFVSFEPALKEYNIPKWRRTNHNMTKMCIRDSRTVGSGQITEILD